MKAIMVGGGGTALSNATFDDTFIVYNSKKEETSVNKLSSLNVTPQKGRVMFSKPGTSSLPSYVEGAASGGAWTLYTTSFDAGCVPIALFHKGNGAMIHFLATDWQGKKIKAFDQWEGLEAAQSDLQNFYAVAAFSEGSYPSSFLSNAQEFETTVNKHYKVPKDNVFAIQCGISPVNLMVRSDGVFGCATDKNLTTIRTAKPKKNESCNIL